MNKIKWFLFPAVYDKGHKPLIKWKKGSSDNTDTWAAWKEKWPGCYLCVDTRKSGITIVDIDVKRGKNGLETLGKLQIEHGPLPKTLTVKTPSGGLHYYFKGVSPYSVQRLGEGIDTPVMAPIPGSSVPGKGAYKVIEKGPIAVLPPWVSELLKTEEGDDPDFEIESGEEIDRAIKYLVTTAPVAIEGEGGDATTYKVAANLKDMGLSLRDAYQTMLSHWNERCEPPWDAEELKNKVVNAYKYGRKGQGVLAPEGDFTRFKRLGAFSLIEPPKPPGWIIQDLVPRGQITGFFGTGGVGKSYLTLQMALSVAAGLPFLGSFITTQIPVIYIGFEDPTDEIERRLFTILQHSFFKSIKENPRGCPFFYTSFAGELAPFWFRISTEGIERTSIYTALQKEIKMLTKQHKLIIVDTITDAAWLNENDRHQVNAMLKKGFGSFIKDTDSSLIFIGHTPKLTQANYSGSTQWQAAIRSGLVLKPHSDEEWAELGVLEFNLFKSNYASELHSLSVIREDTFQIVDSDGLKNKRETIEQENRDAVYQYLKEHPQITFTIKPRGDLSIATQKIYYQKRELSILAKITAAQQLHEHGLIVIENSNIKEVL